MGEAASRTFVDYPTYLRLEQEAGVRHEWLDGHVYAMAGGTLEHGQLSVAIASELRALAGSCGCKVFSSDAKLRVQATGLATYPDASVVCGAIERDPEDRHAMTNPAVLVEVLSEGTEAYDRGEKFGHYRQLPSLSDYVLVSQHRVQVEVYTRDERGRWVLTVAGPGQRFSLGAMPGSIEVDRIYAGVDLLPPPAGPRGVLQAFFAEEFDEPSAAPELLTQPGDELAKHGLRLCPRRALRELPQRGGGQLEATCLARRAQLVEQVVAVDLDGIEGVVLGEGAREQGPEVRPARALPLLAQRILRTLLKQQDLDDRVGRLGRVGDGDANVVTTPPPALAREVGASRFIGVPTAHPSPTAVPQPLMNVACGVDVAVLGVAAVRAPMLPHVQPLADLAPAFAAELRRPVGIDTMNLSTGALSLVREDRDELRPASVVDLPGQHPGRQALDVEVFHRDGVVLLELLQGAVVETAQEPQHLDQRQFLLARGVEPVAEDAHHEPNRSSLQPVGNKPWGAALPLGPSRINFSEILA